MAINQKRSLLHIQSFIICLFIRSEEKEQKNKTQAKREKEK